MSSVTSNLRESSLELDSHADTSCLGGDALVLADHEQPVNVTGYDKALGSKTFRTVTGAVLYDHPDTGVAYILIIAQAVSMPDLEHHLLCPMQCRVNDVVVNDCPRIFAENCNSKTH